MNIPENATELRLDAPSEDLKVVRLLVDFGGRHRGNTVDGGKVTIYSDIESVTVKRAGQVELRTTSPIVHYVAENVPDLLIQAVGWEQSQLSDYHARYVRQR